MNTRDCIQFTSDAKVKRPLSTLGYPSNLGFDLVADNDSNARDFVFLM